MISNVCREVYRRFPEMDGSRPKIQIYGPEKASGTNFSPKYLLVFKGKGQTSSRRAIGYFVRVIVNEQGKILKMSMSR